MNNLLKWFQNFLKTEPTIGASILQAFIAVGLAFGWWHWSIAQTGAVVGMAAVLTGMAVRSQVIPVVTLEKLNAKKS